MNQKMDLSIIIVNYNTLELTKACIESVVRNTHGIEYEIIVVDNNSNDGSQTYLASNSDILFIESGDNLGFGRANNLGFKHSTGRYLLMLNSDTLVENNILSRMINLFDMQPKEVGCIGSLLVHGDHQPCFSYGYYPRWQDEFKWGKKEKNTTTIAGAQQEVEYISGADLFVRREVAEKYGLFDPDFFMYYEDVEIGYRYWKHGYKSVILSENGIVHLDGGSHKSSYRKVCMTSSTYILYLRKTLGHFEYLVAKTLIIIRRSFTVWHYHWSFNESMNYIKMLIKA